MGAEAIWGHNHGGCFGFDGMGSVWLCTLAVALYPVVKAFAAFKAQGPGMAWVPLSRAVPAPLALAGGTANFLRDRYCDSPCLPPRRSGRCQRLAVEIAIRSVAVSCRRYPCLAGCGRAHDCGLRARWQWVQP